MTQPISFQWEKKLVKDEKIILHRYYTVLLVPTPFGKWVMTKIYGGSRRKHVSLEHVTFEDNDSCYQQVERIKKRRVARGYVQV